MPAFIQNKIKIKYAHSVKNQKAMLQYAFALWMTLEPEQDPESVDERLDRALDCTYFRDIPYHEKRDLDAEIFFTDELTRKFLEWNKQFAGQIIQGRDYNEASCD